MLVTISRYSFPYEAHIAKSRLDSEGIPSFVADEHTINMQWLYSNALGGVRLQVPEAYAEASIAILSEDREEDLVEEYGIETKKCAYCGSYDTEFYPIGRRWAFLVFLGLDFPLFPVKDGIKCKQCGKVSKT
ncbi:phosphoenolpyruvate synthase [Nitrincola sp. A-D6]|uniref:putative signal transducing protein n=1 Tax=Nitrincola sp. A-D6 TaxID=1545442 RepID=UPI00051FED32|nr:DUF2007 domain-containing protein [Nitrincola sp. A-D6]KGK42730.1 phosphoenolpyruvate synthase [Nitrincola sp. A-D6]